MHQPMKQLPERAISEEEAREILHDAEYCVVATVDEDGYPYATPLSYALDKDTLLIHTGAAGGQKTDDWERDPRVCVTAAMDMEPVFVEENGEPGFFTTRFASVIATGTVRRVTEMAEIRRALALLCLKYAPEYKDEIGGRHRPRAIRYRRMGHRPQPYLRQSGTSRTQRQGSGLASLAWRRPACARSRLGAATHDCGVRSSATPP